MRFLSNFNPSLGLNFAAASQNLCLSAFSGDLIKAHEKNFSCLPQRTVCGRPRQQTSRNSPNPSRSTGGSGGTTSSVRSFTPTCSKKSACSRAPNATPSCTASKPSPGKSKQGRFRWKAGLEDVHMNLEAELTRRVPAGAKLHTARSRNDQVALDMRLWLRDEIVLLLGEIADLQRALVIAR